MGKDDLTVDDLQELLSDIREAISPADIECASDAEKWVERKYPHIQACFSGIDVRILRLFLVQFDRLFTVLPEVSQRIRAIASQPLPWMKDKAVAMEFFKRPESEMACSGIEPVTEDGLSFKDLRSFVLLKSSSFGNLDRLLGELEGGHYPMFHPPGTNIPQGIVSHEFGHLLEIYLMQHCIDSLTDFKREAFDLDEWDMERSAVRGYGLVGEMPGFVSIYASSFQDRYARASETFAEGFTALCHSPKRMWSPYTKALHGFLDEMFGRELEPT